MRVACVNSENTLLRQFSGTSDCLIIAQRDSSSHHRSTVKNAKSVDFSI
jgi:hypothetical protein